jgi:hypothetical protein
MIGAESRGICRRRTGTTRKVGAISMRSAIALTGTVWFETVLKDVGRRMQVGAVKQERIPGCKLQSFDETLGIIANVRVLNRRKRLSPNALLHKQSDFQHHESAPKNTRVTRGTYTYAL